MRKILAITVSLIMVLAMAVPVFAASKTYVVDKAGVLGTDTETKCGKMASDYAEKTGVDIVVALVDESGNAYDICDKMQKDYSDECVILVDNRNTNKIGIRAYGKTKTVIDDNKCNQLFDVYNNDDTYAGAITSYIETASKMIDDSGIFMTEVAQTEPSEAAETVASTGPGAIPDHRLLPRLNDEADLLTDEEEERVTKALDEYSEANGRDVVVYFTNSFAQDTVAAAADDYYDYNGFGIGDEREGTVLFVCMGTRDVYVSACGSDTTSWITDSVATGISEDVAPYLSEENYEEACMEFIEQIDYNTVDHYNFIAMIGFIIIFIAIGIGVAAARISRNRAQLKSVRFKAEANNYLRDGSLDITRSNARFVNHTVDRVYDPLPDDDDNGDGHISSSGTYHTGGGSKF